MNKYLIIFFSLYTFSSTAQIPGSVYNSNNSSLFLRSAPCTTSTAVTSMPTGGKLFAVSEENSCNGIDWIKVDVVGNHFASAPSQLYCAFGQSYMSSLDLMASILSPGSGGPGTLTAIGSGGVPGYTFIWSTSSISQTIATPQSSIYSVTITDALNCKLTYSSSGATSNRQTCTGSNYVTVFNSPNGLSVLALPAGSNLWVNSNYAKIENGQRFITTDSTYDLAGITWYQIYVPTNVKSAINGSSLGTAWINGQYLIHSANNIPTNNLVAYYPFTGNAADSSGNGNNGTVYGATLTNDRFGHPNSAYYFNGVNNYISIPDNPSLNFNNYSISLWVKLETAPIPQSGFIISKGCESQIGIGVSYRIYYDANNYNYVMDNWAPNRSYINGPLNNIDPEWTHLGFTYNSTINKMYMNGVLVNNINQSSILTSNSDPLLIGARTFFSNCNFNEYFKGKIDDISIYDRELSSTEVYSLYNNVKLPLLSNITFTNHVNQSHFQDVTLWSGDIQQVPPNPTIKICADGSEATIIKYVNANLNIPSSNIKFWIHSDPYGLNPQTSGYVIDYSVVGNIITATLKHPDYLNVANSEFKSDFIDIVDYTNNAVIFQMPIQIYRAPILFIHGFQLNQNPANTFDEMTDYLIQQGLYPGTSNISQPALSSSPLIKRIIYESFEGFAANAWVPRSGINDIFKQLRENNFSAGKVDVVAHSLGGVLTRLYLQNNYGVKYKNDIHKFITLNSPHSGLKLASFVYDGMYEICLASSFLSRNSFTCSDGLRDLRVDSYAIDHELNDPLSLLSQATVPTHIMTSDFSASSITTDPVAQSLIRFILGKTIVGNIINTYESIVFNNESNDVAVSLSSQKGGIQGGNYVDFFPFVFHVGSPDRAIYKSRIIELLNANPISNLFTTDGFNPPDITFPFPFLHPTTTFAFTNSTSQSDSVTIVTPTNGQSFFSGDTITISVSATSGIYKIMTAVGNDLTPIYAKDTLSNEQSFSYVIPETSNGEIRIISIASDSINFIDLDTIKIKIDPIATLDSITIVPAKIFLSTREHTQFRIVGYYSDNVTRELSYNDSVNYTMADSTIAQYIGGNQIEGKNIGTTSITANYKNKSSSSILSVSSGIMINADVTSACAGSIINFMFQTSIDPINIIWQFAGGSPGTDTSNTPSITYNNSGNFDVSLFAIYPDKIDTVKLLKYITVDSCPITLNLKLFIQGLYKGNEYMQAALFNSKLYLDSNACDSITIELHNEIAPFNLVYKTNGIIGTKGFGSYLIPNEFSESYYIVIKHRNLLETWSSQPVSFNNTSVDYNFTTALSKAFGNNLIDLGDGNFGIFSGDVDQNGIINLIDFASIQDNTNLFITGYLTEDLTGDGLIESSDYSLIENNIGRILIRP